jgi:hypothetical protein
VPNTPNATTRKVCTGLRRSPRRGTGRVRTSSQPTRKANTTTLDLPEGRARYHSRLPTDLRYPWRLLAEKRAGHIQNRVLTPIRPSLYLRERFGSAVIRQRGSHRTASTRKHPPSGRRVSAADPYRDVRREDVSVQLIQHRRRPRVPQAHGKTRRRHKRFTRYATAPGQLSWRLQIVPSPSCAWRERDHREGRPFVQALQRWGLSFFVIGLAWRD